PPDGSVQAEDADDNPGAARRGRLRRGVRARRGAHPRRGGRARSGRNRARCIATSQPASSRSSSPASSRTLRLKDPSTRDNGGDNVRDSQSSAARARNGSRAPYATTDDQLPWSGGLEVPSSNLGAPTRGRAWKRALFVDSEAAKSGRNCALCEIRARVEKVKAAGTAASARAWTPRAAPSLRAAVGTRNLVAIPNQTRWLTTPR